MYYPVQVEGGLFSIGDYILDNAGLLPVRTQIVNQTDATTFALATPASATVIPTIASGSAMSAVANSTGNLLDGWATSPGAAAKVQAVARDIVPSSRVVVLYAETLTLREVFVDRPVSSQTVVYTAVLRFTAIVASKGGLRLTGSTAQVPQ